MTPQLEAEEQREILVIELAAVLRKLDRLYDDQREEEKLIGHSLGLTNQEVAQLENRWAELEAQLA